MQIDVGVGAAAPHAGVQGLLQHGQKVLLILFLGLCLQLDCGESARRIAHPSLADLDVMVSTGYLQACCNHVYTISF